MSTLTENNRARIHARIKDVREQLNIAALYIKDLEDFGALGIPDLRTALMRLQTEVNGVEAINKVE